MFRPFRTHRQLPTLLFSALMLSSVAVLASATKSPRTEPAAHVATRGDHSKPSNAQQVLPEVFAGWQLSGTLQNSSQPEAADAANAAVLREFGFTRYQSGTYSRGKDTLSVRAIKFGDATGAYGTFTFYRTPNMVSEKIGQGAAFDGARVLFWQGTVLVDAKFSRPTPMSISELRELTAELPKPVGNQGTMPTLPGYLPHKYLDAMSVQYAIGPMAYDRSGGASGPVLPNPLVDFNRSAEVVTARYAVLNNGILTIINYPTSDIARDRFRAIRSYLAAHGAAMQPGNKGPQLTNAVSYPLTQAIADSNSAALLVRRSGPLVIVTSGGFSAEDAQQTIERVHYEVILTGNKAGVVRSDSSKVAQIILSVAVMVGIFAIIALVSAISLGGGRIAWRRLRQKRGDAAEEPEEFIRLNLRE